MRALANQPPAGAGDYIPGKQVAVTPGKVVWRNRLMELLQYSPATPTVRPEPVLIVPAWIMKYYILDLSPHNSLIAYLVRQGHTVFCISWKNPGAQDRELGMDDYLALGIGEALDAIAAIVPDTRVHAAGYCLGGTLLAIAASAMARDGDTRRQPEPAGRADRLQRAGRAGAVHRRKPVSLLEAQMARTGYLTSRQMAGAFQMLRSYDLLWSRMINEYLLAGERPCRT